MKGGKSPKGKGGKAPGKDKPVKKGTSAAPVAYEQLPSLPLAVEVAAVNLAGD